MLNSKQRAYLFKLSNDIKPFMQIGRDGLQESGLEHILTAFNASELLKVKVLENDPSLIKHTCKKICDYTGAECVKIIGKTIVLYKPMDDPRIELS